MPSTVAGPSAETPPKVRGQYDQIVKSLNLRWNLGLPLLHGSPETAKHEGITFIDTIARRCSGQIRFMCFRDCGLDKAIKEFEENADQIVNSNWVFKPMQEKGTIPKNTTHGLQPEDSVRRRQLTKTFISKRPVVSPHHREILVKQLFEDLKDDFALAQTSGSFKRTSAVTNKTMTAPNGPSVPDDQGQNVPSNRLAPTSLVKKTQWSLQPADKSPAAFSSASRLSVKRKSTERQEVWSILCLLYQVKLSSPHSDILLI